MSARGAATLAASAMLALAALLGPVPAAGAEEATWSGFEQPTPPGSAWPVGLGSIGDIEFWAPNRGLLITGGEGKTVPAGLWAYNGVDWHEYATQCGASEADPEDGGRIAWASPDEFWTVSDGRKGQANESSGNGQFEREPPLEDNTLCHFAGGEIVGSYAHPAFQSDSYMLMHAAACLGPSDCWFGGDPLEEPEIGAFHLHWNGSSLEEEPYTGEGHAVEDIAALEGTLYESVLLARTDRGEGKTVSVIHRINAPGITPVFEPEQGLFGEGLPLGQSPKGLDFLHLSSADGALWAAAGTKRPEPGQVTVLRDVGGNWTQLIGPEHPLAPILADPEEEAALLGGEARQAVVSAVAAEPGTGTAWIALEAPGASSASRSAARAVLLHVSSEGTVLAEQTLPSPGEEAAGIGPKGAASRLSCPATNDCWLATAQGWLFHFALPSERTLGRDPAESEYFSGQVIEYRPADQGLPQVTPDAPPEDDSGLEEEAPDYGGTFAEAKASAAVQPTVTLPLLSRVHSRLLHGHTLELRFHLAVKARVQLVAMRKRAVVAQTPRRTFGAGNRELLLNLNPHRWPTKLNLQTHALAPLPVVSSVAGEGAGVTTETTGLYVLPRDLLQSGLETRR